jgi:hypothetical protein
VDGVSEALTTSRGLGARMGRCSTPPTAPRLRLFFMDAQSFVSAPREDVYLAGVHLPRVRRTLHQSHDQQSAAVAICVMMSRDFGSSSRM